MLGVAPNTSNRIAGKQMVEGQLLGFVWEFAIVDRKRHGDYDMNIQHRENYTNKHKEKQQQQTAFLKTEKMRKSQLERLGRSEIVFNMNIFWG